jgi:adenosine deaminase
LDSIKTNHKATRFQIPHIVFDIHSNSLATMTNTNDKPASVVASERDLRSLPKAELHLHLEGAMRPSTLLELCHKYSIPPPIIPILQNNKDSNASVIPETMERFTDFSAFVKVYIAACDCLRQEEDLYRLILEVAQDLQKCGVAWTEIAPSFTFYAERFGGMAATLGIIAKAAEVAEKETGVGIGLVLSVERQLGVDGALELAHLARRGTKEWKICGRNAVVGFGLHGPEEGFPPALFQEAFDVACGDGVIASLPHAGEIAPGPGEGPKSVLDSAILLKATRIAHGVLAANDIEVLTVLRDSNICLDICVTSNYLLNVVTSRKDHPLPHFLKEGVKCTINSDDPLLFGCDIFSEFELCRRELNMNDDLLADCAKASFEYSRAPDSLRFKGLNGIDDWLSF